MILYTVATTIYHYYIEVNTSVKNKSSILLDMYIVDYVLEFVLVLVPS